MLIPLRLNVHTKGPGWRLPPSEENGTKRKALGALILLKSLSVCNSFCALASLAFLFFSVTMLLYFRWSLQAFSHYTRLLPSLPLVVNTHSSFQSHRRLSLFTSWIGSPSPTIICWLLHSLHGAYRYVIVHVHMIIWFWVICVCHTINSRSQQTYLFCLILCCVPKMESGT